MSRCRDRVLFVAPFSAFAVAIVLLGVALVSAPSRAQPTVLCQQLTTSDAPDQVTDAPCLERTNGAIERRGDFLTVHAAGGNIILGGDAEACDAAQANDCRPVSLYAYNAEQNYAVLEQLSRYGRRATLIDLKTGGRTPLDARPAFSPSGRQMLTIASVLNLSLAQIELAIYDVTTAPPDIRFAVPFGMAPALIGRDDATLGFKFVAWPEETRIVLRVDNPDKDGFWLVPIEVKRDAWMLGRPSPGK